MNLIFFGSWRYQPKILDLMSTALCQSYYDVGNTRYTKYTTISFANQMLLSNLNHITITSL